MNAECIRYLADENFRGPIVRGLKRLQPAIDITTVVEAGKTGIDDITLLAFAAQEHRILLTHDEHTMPGHFTAFLQDGNHSPGVFLFHDDEPMQSVIDFLNVTWGASEPEEWIDMLVHCP